MTSTLESKFYEQQSEGLGAYFLDTMASDIESLLVHGGLHSKVYGLHRSLSKRFPYAIFYQVEENAILIYGVLDCRREPNALCLRLLGR